MVEKKKEEGKVRFKLKGQLKLYIQWPAIMALLLMAMNIWIYEIDRNAGLLMLVFVLIYIAMIAVLYFYSKSIIMKDLVDLLPSMELSRIRCFGNWLCLMQFFWMMEKHCG